jgi:hypothetical protein
VRGGITGQGSAIRANVVTRGRLACEGSACPLPCGVRELDIVFLFRLSPKAALNPNRLMVTLRESRLGGISSTFIAPLIPTKTAVKRASKTGAYF